MASITLGAPAAAAWSPTTAGPGTAEPGFRAGAAPDLIHIGDRYYMAYASSGGGLGGGHASTIRVKWSKTLDPNSPDYAWNDDHVVASSDGIEDCDAIDPGFLLDPTMAGCGSPTGLTSASSGSSNWIPRRAITSKATSPSTSPLTAKPPTRSIATAGIIFLALTAPAATAPTPPTTSAWAAPSRVTGPYLDNLGNDMLKGGGKLVAAASGRFVGLGHFGLMDLGDGVQKFSCHYEADLDRGGRSVLDIRPLLWKDGWPVGGDNFKEGTYQIQSESSGYALELAVDFVRMAGGRGGFGGFGGRGGRGGFGGGGDAPGGTNAPGGRGFGGGFGGRGGGGPVTPVPAQTLAEVSSNWPAGNLDIRLGDFMIRPHQKWTISAVTNASGFPGSPCFKITIAGTDRALAATADAEVVAVPAFTGAPEQLWRIDQLTDGTYRIMPKVVPNSTEPLVLTAVGYSTPTLAKFDPKSDKSRWNFKTP